MKSTVYIESTIISYLTARPSRDLVAAAHQQVTSDWWEDVFPQVDSFVSQFVQQEISRGDPEAAKKRLDAVVDLPLLEVNDDIQKLAEHYMAKLNIPERAKLDVAHLAVWKDPIVEDIRKVRSKIETENDNSFEKIFAQAIKAQKQFVDRLVSRSSYRLQIENGSIRPLPQFSQSTK